MIARIAAAVLAVSAPLQTHHRGQCYENAELHGTDDAPRLCVDDVCKRPDSDPPVPQEPSPLKPKPDPDPATTADWVTAVSMVVTTIVATIALVIQILEFEKGK